MAIYFDNKLLLPNENGNELEKSYFKGLKKIDSLLARFGGSIRIMREWKKQYSLDKQSFKPAPPFALPTSFSMYVENMGAVEVRYSKTAPIKRGDNISWNSVDIMIEEGKVFTKEDADLAWFLILATNFVKNGILKIHDELEDVKKESEKFVANSKLNALLASAQEVTLDKIISGLGFSVPRNASPSDKAYLIAKNLPTTDAVTIAKVTESLLKEQEKQLASPADGKAYTEEELQSFSIADLNKVAAKLGAVKCPPSTKVNQIQDILIKQGGGG